MEEATRQSDPIKRLLGDMSAPAITAKVMHAKARCALSEDRRQALLAIALVGDGSMLLEEIEHLRMMSYYDGRQDQMDSVVEHFEKKVTHTDTGDGVPLAIIGPGGDFCSEVRP